LAYCSSPLSVGFEFISFSVLPIIGASDSRQSANLPEICQPRFVKSRRRKSAQRGKGRAWAPLKRAHIAGLLAAKALSATVDQIKQESRIHAFMNR
jgi:hypothetical protein